MTDNPPSRSPAQSSQGTDLPVPMGTTAAPIAVPAATPTTASPDTPQPPAPINSPDDVEPRSAFASDVHQYIRSYIQLADQKAMFFFAGATAMLAFLYKNNLSARWLKAVETWSVLDALTFVGMGGLAVASFMALLVVVPRIPGSRRGYVFWEAIAEFRSGREYADDLASLSAASLLQLRAEHCFELARVCRTKYAMLRRALTAGAIGLVATLLVLLFVPAS